MLPIPGSILVSVEALPRQDVCRTFARVFPTEMCFIWELQVRVFREHSSSFAAMSIVSFATVDCSCDISSVINSVVKRQGAFLLSVQTPQSPSGT